MLSPAAGTPRAVSRTWVVKYPPSAAIGHSPYTRSQTARTNPTAYYLESKPVFRYMSFIVYLKIEHILFDYT